MSFPNILFFQSIRKHLLVLLAISLSFLWGVKIAFKTIVLSDLFFLGLLVTHGMIFILNSNWKQRLREFVPLMCIVSAAFSLLLLSSYFTHNLDFIVIKELFRFAYSFLFFLVIASLDVDNKDFEQVSKAIVFVGTIINVISILTLIIYYLFNTPTPFIRTFYVFGAIPIQGFTLSPKTHLIFCFIYLSFNVFLVIRHQTKTFYKLLLIINLFASLLTFQKEIFYLFLLPSLFVLFFIQKKRAKLWLSSSLFIIFIFLQTLAFFTAVFYVVPIVVKDGIDWSKPLFSYTKHAYYYHYSSGINMFVSSPVYGKGLGKYGTYMLDYLSPEDSEGYLKKKYIEFHLPKETAKNWPIAIDPDPHSTWIGIAAEAGLMGLTGLFIIFFYVILSLYRKLTASEKLIPSILLSLIICLMLISTQFDFIYLKILWFVMGLSVSICRKNFLDSYTSRY